MMSAPTQPRSGRGGPPPFAREREPREYRDPRDGPPYGNSRGGRGGGGYNGPLTPRGYDSRPPPGPRASSSHNNEAWGPSPRGPPSRSPPPHRHPYPPPPRDRGGPDRALDRPPGPERPPPFRSNNSSSTSYPQTRYFNNAGPGRKPSVNANPLGNLEKPVEGGKKLPSTLDPKQEARLRQLEDEQKKLVEQIEEKERLKRQKVREWDDAERESRREGLKSELAEGHLERLSGDGGGGAAY